MIPIAKPLIGEEEIKEVGQVLKSGMLAQGPRVEEFEKNFSNYIGIKESIAVNSGTSALHLALLANDIKAGDEVITTPFTFISTANSILFTGAKPVFVDIEEDTFNINAEKIVEEITPNTKAILPVHLYGQAADMKAIMEIAQDHNLQVIEDACQAHGAEFQGKKVGSFATGCFSFYSTKNIITGEGGIITTNEEEISKKARMLRNHGSQKRYYHDRLGYNYRMTDLAAAIGIIQLKKLPEFNKKRIENASYMTEKLKPINGIITPKIKEKRVHVFNQYTIRIKQEFGERDKVMEILNKNGIGTGIYYPVPIHKQKVYLNLGYQKNLPVAEKAAQEVLSLPIHPSITKKDLDKIANILMKIKNGED